MLDKSDITTLSNPRIKELKKQHPYLRGLHFDAEDERVRLPSILFSELGIWPESKLLHAEFVKLINLWQRRPPLVGLWKEWFTSSVFCHDIARRLPTILQFRCSWSAGSPWKRPEFGTWRIQGTTEETGWKLFDQSPMETRTSGFGKPCCKCTSSARWVTQEARTWSRFTTTVP